MADTEPVTETWAYAGVRDNAGQRTHAWYDPKDRKLRYWRDRRAYMVGGLYHVQVTREEDHLYRTGFPQYAGRSAKDTGEITTGLITGWEIDHDHDEAKLRRRTAEKHVKARGGIIDQACEPVCELAVNVKSFTELESLMAAVKRRMIDAWDSNRRKRS